MLLHKDKPFNNEKNDRLKMMLEMNLVTVTKLYSQLNYQFFQINCHLLGELTRIII